MSDEKDSEGQDPSLEVPVVPKGAAEGAVSPEDAALVDSMFADGKLDLASMTIPDTGELLKDSIASEMAEEINTASGVSVFATADKFAMRYMMEKIVPLLPAKLRGAAKYVVEHTNFSQVPKGSEAAFQILSHNKQALSRKLILHMIGSGDRGFDGIEKAELVHGIAIADAIDEMYIKWERMGHSIPETDDRLKQGFKSPYHIVQLRDGKHQEVPYKEIFADEYAAIDAALGRLINDLLRFTDQGPVQRPRTPEADRLAEVAQTKLNYYISLRVALNGTNPEELPKLWKAVDAAYVHQGGRFIVSLLPETGYGVNETGAIPEYFLRMDWPEHDASKMAQYAERQIVDELPAFAEDKKGVSEGISRVAQSGYPKISYFAIRSGLELVFEIAGQNLPNDPDVGSKEGFLGTVSPDVMKKRMVESSGLFKKFFDPQCHNLLDLIDDDAVLADVMVHEMGHNVGTSKHFPNSFERNSLEEWKASALECVLHKLRIDDLQTDELAGIFVADACQALRYCQERQSASQRLYYGAYKFFMKTAQEVGLVHKSGDKWRFDLSREKLVAYTDAVSDQWLQIQDICDSGSNNDLLAFAGNGVMANTPLVEDMERTFPVG